MAILIVRAGDVVTVSGLYPQVTKLSPTEVNLRLRAASNNCENNPGPYWETRRRAMQAAAKLFRQVATTGRVEIPA